MNSSVAENLLAMASSLPAMASNLLAMASKLPVMASRLLVMASDLLAMASDLPAMASNLLETASNSQRTTIVSDEFGAHLLVPKISSNQILQGAVLLNRFSDLQCTRIYADLNRCNRHCKKIPNILTATSHLTLR